MPKDKSEVALLKPSRYSVIYSIDCVREESVRKYYPRDNVRRKMRRTEDDSNYEYDYLGGVWKKGHHAKLVGLLSPRHFAEFVSSCGLYPENCDTMGSLGAPGFGLGWAPAISFNADAYSAILSAYVTPIPPSEPQEITEEQWEAMRAYVMKEFR